MGISAFFSQLMSLFKMSLLDKIKSIRKKTMITNLPIAGNDSMLSKYKNTLRSFDALELYLVNYVVRLPHTTTFILIPYE